MKKFTFFLSFAIAANLIFVSASLGQIAQRGATTTASISGSTNLTINKPAYVEQGDVMIANIVKENNGTDNPVLLGWTVISSGSINNGGDIRGAVLYKIAGSSEPASYTFALGAGTNDAVGTIVAFSGVDITGGVNESGVAGGPFDSDPGNLSLSLATSTTITATGGTSVNTPQAVIVMLAQSSDDNTFSGWATTSPSIFAELYESPFNSANDDLSVGAAMAFRSSAGPTGNGTATSGNDFWGGLVIALRPLPAASLTPRTTQSVAVGGNVAFTATAINFGGAGNYTYDWDAPGATIPGPDPNSIAGASDSKTLTFPTAGTYNVSVTVSRGGATTRITNTTVVYAIATPTLANAPINSPDPCEDDGVAITSNTCLPGTFSASFANGVLYLNNGNSGLAVGSIWRYSSVASNGDGDIFNAEITVDATHQASLTQFDDDAATDELGNQTLQAFFAPRIDPDISLGATNRSGFVQFTIRFWKNGWSVPALLDNIVYSHYDIDGTNNGYYFRETGVVKHPGGFLQVTADANTELVQYSYLAGADNWTGFAGTICNRSNFSRYAEVAASFKYPIFQSSVTIRMGYDYQDLPGGSTYGNQDPRLYASKFECFSFPQETNLPVKLISFNGSYKNNNTLLNWVAENQVDFHHYEIERSSDGVNFNYIGIKPVQGSNSSREYYNYSDNLMSESGNIFYYRLKMVDADGTFKYSKTILIRKDQKTLAGVTINPNPLLSGSTATVRFEVQAKSIVTFKVIDMSGRVLLTQQNNVTEGINSVSVNNFERLQPGTYVLQMNDGISVQTTKFVISK